MGTPDWLNKLMDKQIPQPMPPSSWPEELSGVLADMQGNPINIQRLMANNPLLLNAWWPFRNHTVRGGTLGQRKAELLILRVSVHMHSWYEWACHVDRALKVGIEIEQIFELLKPATKISWAEEDRALILAVDELTANHQISSETLALLTKHYSNEQIMDLMAIQGMYQILAAMIKTWGLALDSDTAERLSNITDETSFLKAAQSLT